MTRKRIVTYPSVYDGTIDRSKQTNDKVYILLWNLSKVTHRVHQHYVPTERAVSSTVVKPYSLMAVTSKDHTRVGTHSLSPACPAKWDFHFGRSQTWLHPSPQCPCRIQYNPRTPHSWPQLMALIMSVSLQPFPFLSLMKCFTETKYPTIITKHQKKSFFQNEILSSKNGVTSSIKRLSTRKSKIYSHHHYLHMARWAPMMLIQWTHLRNAHRRSLLQKHNEQQDISKSDNSFGKVPLSPVNPNTSRVPNLSHWSHYPTITVVVYARLALTTKGHFYRNYLRGQSWESRLHKQVPFSCS